jgi:hypothetical protein
MSILNAGRCDREQQRGIDIRRRRKRVKYVVLFLYKFAMYR